MANDASVTVTATLLPDEIAKTFTGTIALAPEDVNDKWYYKKTNVTADSGLLMSGYFTDYTAVDGGTAPTAVASGDKVKFLFVKNTDAAESLYIVPPITSLTAGNFVIGDTYVITSAGTTDFTLIGAADSNVGTSFTATGVGAGDGTAEPPAGTEATGFHLGPDEAVTIRLPNRTVGDIHAASSTGTVECIVAALLDDV